jgi:catechol 2,3-dioxygenase-like lactoylglutathione lyase family enzyme
MSMPGGHAKRLFLGFVFSITFLVLFALLIAYNSEAESSSQMARPLEAHPLVVSIPAVDPQRTIDFYKDLGFRQSQDIGKGLDTVCMERDGAPYKLEIWSLGVLESKDSHKVVSALSFPVNDLSETLTKIRNIGKWEVREGRLAEGPAAFLKDPNGIEVKLIQQRYRN